MGEGEASAGLDTMLRARARLDVVKLNVVVRRGRNDDEFGDFLEWSRTTGVSPSGKLRGCL